MNQGIFLGEVVLAIENIYVLVVLKLAVMSVSDLIVKKCLVIINLDGKMMIIICYRYILFIINQPKMI